MASFRHHTRVSLPPDEVFAVLRDVTTVPQWFPGITHAEFNGTHRVITLGNGMTLLARVVTDDPELRRFQYQFVGGFPIPVDFHLGTIDVIEDGDGSLVVYSQQVEPEGLAENVGNAVRGGIDGIASYFAVPVPS